MLRISTGCKEDGDKWDVKNNGTTVSRNDCTIILCRHQPMSLWKIDRLGDRLTQYHLRRCGHCTMSSAQPDGTYRTTRALLNFRTTTAWKHKQKKSELAREILIPTYTTHVRNATFLDVRACTAGSRLKCDNLVNKLLTDDRTAFGYLDISKLHE